MINNGTALIKGLKGVLRKVVKYPMAITIPGIATGKVTKISRASLPGSFFLAMMYAALVPRMTMIIVATTLYIRLLEIDRPIAESSKRSPKLPRVVSVGRTVAGHVFAIDNKNTPVCGIKAKARTMIMKT